MQTSVELDAETARRLDILARKTGRSRDFHVKEAIAQGLEDIEDYYLAHDTLRRISNGEEKVYSLDEAEAMLGLKK